MITIGIDPGLSGAVAVLTDDGAAVFDMMTMPIGKGKGRVKNKVNAAALASVLRKYASLNTIESGGPVIAKVEKVGSMPGQGVAGVHSLGHSSGVIEGVLAALQIPYEMVTPQRWKKAAGLIASEKDAARTVAQQLFPMCELERKKDIGRADALLIAKFG